VEPGVGANWRPHCERLRVFRNFHRVICLEFPYGSEAPVDEQLEWTPLGDTDEPAGWLHVVTRRFRYPSGTVAAWDLIDEGDCVSVLPVTSDGLIVLVRMYRPGPGRVLYDLPGGYVEAGEAPAKAASRELLEETGYAGECQVIASTWTSARNVHREWICLAVDCVKLAEPLHDGDECLEVVLTTKDDFEAVLRGGEMTTLGSAYRAFDAIRGPF
jgi:ADP-ribose pyrophosphatase